MSSAETALDMLISARGNEIEAFHRYMSGYCADAGGRLWWVGASTMRDISKSIAQLEYWTKGDRYFAGLQIPRACPDGRMLDNPDLHRLYAAAEALGMPLCLKV